MSYRWDKLQLVRRLIQTPVRHCVRLSVIARDQTVRFGVACELFLRVVPGQLAADAVADVGQVAQAGGSHAGLDVRG